MKVTKCAHGATAVEPCADCERAAAEADRWLRAHGIIPTTKKDHRR